MSHPSNEDDATLERATDAYPAPILDNILTSDQWSASPPSPPALCGHPRRCAAIPGTATPSPALWELRMTPAIVLLQPLINRTLESAYGWRPNGEFPHSHPRSRSWESTGLATMADGSEIRQDDHQLHDIVRHAAICSLRTVRHDCKPPLLGL
jgi:hypothetical protein